MDKDKFNNEKLFQVSVSLARKMLADGVLTDEEFARFCELMAVKYTPVIGLLPIDI